MTEWFLVISGLMTGVLRVLICSFFIYRLLASKRPDKRSVFCGAAGSCVISAALFLFPLPDICRMGLEAFWIAVCAGKFQKTDIRMSLFVSIFYEIGFFFWQFLISAGLGIVFRSELYLERNCPQGQAGVWLLCLLLTVLAAYLVRRPDISRKDGFRLTSMIALAGFIAVITLSEQKTLVISEDTLTMWTILSVVLLMSVLVFHINRQYEAEKEAARLRAEQAELLERDYTALSHAYGVNARLFHDFHNHIGVLRQMLSRQNYDGAAAYLDELHGPVREMADTVWTGDETVDYLINSKAAMAAAGQISMQVQVEFPRRTNIRSADLCAVIGNLLDNALEAAGRISEPEQRFIRLVIRRINQMLVIKVENSFAGRPKEEDGRLKTTKTEQGLHGWGLKSAQTAAEKYDGMVQTSYDGTVFLAAATLSYHAVSIK